MTGSKSNVGGVTSVAREGVRDAVQELGDWRTDGSLHYSPC